MPRHLISRRQFLMIGGGTVLTSAHLSGCLVGRTVIVRVAPRLRQILSVLIDIAEGAMQIAAIIDMAQTVLGANLNRQDVFYLQNGARLIIIDGGGQEFMVGYDLFDGWATVQTCTPYGKPYLVKGPGVKYPEIRPLRNGENLGVLDENYVKDGKDGWYHVKTSTGETGWVHGNCITRIRR